MVINRPPFEYDEFITEADIEKIENQKPNTFLPPLDRIDLIIKIHFLIQKHLDDIEKKAKYQETLNEHLKVCSFGLKITELQMFLFSFILNRGGIIMLENIAQFFKVTRVQCLKYLDDLDVLVNKRLIRKLYRKDKTEYVYFVHFKVIQALRKGNFYFSSVFPSFKRRIFYSLKTTFYRIYRKLWNRKYDHRNPETYRNFWGIRRSDRKHCP